MCKSSIQSKNVNVVVCYFRWSYGIVLWEIFTLGGSPYPGLPTEDLFSFLEQGRRMDQSELCPLEIYAVMRDCWERNPNDRPLFSQIADRIGQIISNHSGQVKSPLTTFLVTEYLYFCLPLRSKFLN